MKRIIVALALLVCASSMTLVASDLSDAKRSLKSAQKELSSVTSKRNKAQQKQEQLQADYEGALAKMVANQDKPKSLTYKEAVKKSESLSAKLEQNAQLLTSLNRQMDSLQNVVSNYESALRQVQEKAVEEIAEVESEEEIPIISVIEDPALKPVEKDECDEAVELKDNESGVASSAIEETTPSASKHKTFWQKVWSVIKIIFWIFVGIIVLRIFVKIGGKGGSSRSSSSRSSSSSSSSSSRSDDKKRRIAGKQEEIARQQQKIERLKSSINDRKRNGLYYSDLQQSVGYCRERIASLKKDIAHIKAS